MVTDEMRTIISRGGSEEELKAAATKAGYKPLSYDGLKKVLLGFTTVEELKAHASFDFITGV
jgi:type IV pilus assembly protein PilB